MSHRLLHLKAQVLAMRNRDGVKSEKDTLPGLTGKGRSRAEKQHSEEVGDDFHSEFEVVQDRRKIFRQGSLQASEIRSARTGFGKDTVENRVFPNRFAHDFHGEDIQVTSPRLEKGTARDTARKTKSGSGCLAFKSGDFEILNSGATPDHRQWKPAFLTSKSPTEPRDDLIFHRQYLLNTKTANYVFKKV